MLKLRKEGAQPGPDIHPEQEGGRDEWKKVKRRDTRVTPSNKRQLTLLTPHPAHGEISHFTDSLG